MKDLSLKLLGKQQIDSREDGIPRRQEDQSRTSRFKDTGDSYNRLLRVLHVLQQSLADHQIRIRLSAVPRDIGADSLIVHSRWGSRELILVDIQPDQPQAQPALSVQANHRILAAAYVINDASASQVRLDPVV